MSNYFKNTRTNALLKTSFLEFQKIEGIRHVLSEKQFLESSTVLGEN